MSVRVLHGDMREVLPTLSGLDACVCDPPYELSFMGKTWDGTGIAFQTDTWRLVYDALKPGAHLLAFGGSRTFARMFCAIEDAGFEYRDTLMWLYGTGFPKSHNIGNGWGTALKPAFEPIGMFRKPLDNCTVAANVLKHGTGAINIDACRIEANDKTPAPVGQYGGSSIGPTGHNGIRDGSADALGRWPANLLHDGSDEVEAAFAAFGERTSGGVTHQPKRSGFHFASGRDNGTHIQRDPDSGTASRFYYSAKASKADRAGSKHPTVKPLALMRWLVRLVTPPGGTVLDCFAGSGTTGEAAMLEGFNAVLIEREDEYIADINRRIERATQERTTIVTTAQLDMFG